jgi:zinc protease
VTGAQLLTERPTAGAPKPWSFPAFARRTVAGGSVITADLPGRSLAVLSLVLEAGAMTEPTGREGVALLAARALSEGTDNMDAYAFAVAAERLGASWQADVEWDSLRCGFEVPAGELEAAAALLAEAVRRPRLDEETLRRVHAERVDELRVDRSQPRTRAAIAFANAVFQRSSRYSRPSGGDLATVDQLAPDDIRAFHRSRFGGDNATLILVGDLSGTDVDGLAATIFEGWDPVGAARQDAVVAPNSRDRRVVIVDRPGSVQSVLFAGHDGPPRATADYVPMTTMALGLGGMFNSRLNYRLREDKGYAYGAFGGFDCRRDGGVFVARAAVQSEVSAPALEAMVTEIDAVHRDGLTETEARNARDYRAGVFPVSFANTAQVAGGLAEIVVHGHADDHFDRLRSDILSVDKDAIDAAAQARLRPNEMVHVVVGDAGAVADDIRALGLGPVEVVTDVPDS